MNVNPKAIKAAIVVKIKMHKLRAEALELLLEEMNWDKLTEFESQVIKENFLD